MSIAHIIALGHIAYWHVFFTNWWTYVAFVLFIGAVWLSEWGFDQLVEWAAIVGTVGAILLFVSVPIVASSAQQSSISHWRTTYALPYIASLPVSHHPIVYIKVEDTTQVSGDRYDVRSWDLTHLLVLYRNGGTVQKADIMANLAIQLSHTASPYITYRDLPQSLGNGIGAGIYDATVHVPMGYNFAGVK